jgi:hypothetical protein
MPSKTPAPTDTRSVAELERLIVEATSRSRLSARRRSSS